jgi:hypothetical protein
MLHGATAKLVVCVVFATGFGGVQIYRGLRARTQLSVDLARVETGESLLGNWITARGRALWDQPGMQTSKHTATYFVPVVSERWQAARAVPCGRSLRESANYFLLSRGEKPEGLIRDGLVGFSLAGFSLLLLIIFRRNERKQARSAVA